MDEEQECGALSTFSRDCIFILAGIDVFEGESLIQFIFLLLSRRASDVNVYLLDRAVQIARNVVRRVFRSQLDERIQLHHARN